MEEYSMKSALVVAAILVILSSFPLRSQQPATDPQQSQPSATQQQTPPPDTQQPSQPGAAQQPASPSAPQAQPAAPAATDLQPVSGKLESKLDSKTAKTGDSIVVKTETTVKLADGTVIPKGSKLVGRVIGVQAQGEASQNSQVAIQFDHIEVKGGQSVPIQTVIKSVGQAETGSTPENSSAMPNAPQAPGAPAGGMPGSTPGPGPGGSTQQSNASPNMSQPSGGSAPSANSAPAPGTVVARSGNIAIRTTAIPGVLIANNDHGQDPRMAKSSGILLGARRNIELGSGTTIDLDIANTAAH